MMSKRNTEYQNHLLACIGEECGELQQAVGKALRFGLVPDKTPDIRREFSDLLGVMDLYLYEVEGQNLEEWLVDHIIHVHAKTDKVLGYWSEC
jgi:NTP pyrophosphatase (non-canonical NTP hydrolase)